MLCPVIPERLFNLGRYNSDVQSEGLVTLRENRTMTKSMAMLVGSVVITMTSIAQAQTQGTVTRSAPEVSKSAEAQYNQTQRLSRANESRIVGS